MSSMSNQVKNKAGKYSTCLMRRERPGNAAAYARRMTFGIFSEKGAPFFRRPINILTGFSIVPF